MKFYWVGKLVIWYKAEPSICLCLKRKAMKLRL